MTIISKDTSEVIKKTKALPKAIRVGKKSAFTFEKEGVTVDACEPTFVLQFEIGGEEAVMLLSQKAFENLRDDFTVEIPTIQNIVNQLKQK